MILNLIKVGDVPPIGKNKARFLDVKTDSGKDADNNEFNHLIVTVELETKDSKNANYQLAKQYNLAGRGLAMFRTDFRSWCGRKLVDKELAAFDADSIMKGQPVTVVIKHARDGKDTIAVIDTFLPVAAATQAAA